ncbi:MAG TPA: Holliday junction branch migration protein RuvA [Saprospiraceae bacterium]|nr:Holliday junction branch migration protein RuvA [Saprospiraceae bacterium]HQW25905.1 Holliday junction branch migration protein RuvA [Saprospiraceae bacterium]
MFDYIQGKVVARQPTHVVVEAGGIGYLLNITLNSYDLIEEGKVEKVYTWLQVQEDAHRLWGFKEPAERDVFLHLVSVSGIGPNTARLILSGMTPEECRQAILTDNEVAFRQVKGVGPKTAKRVMMELKDKMLKTAGDPLHVKAGSNKNQSVEEAMAALITLGFVKSQAEKVISQIIRDEGRDQPTETLVRMALRMLSA